MSKSIVLICPDNVTLFNLYKILNGQWPEKCSYISGERPEIQVQYDEKNSWYVSFNELMPAQNVFNDYKDDDEVPLNIKEELVEKVFFLLSFNDYKSCASIIRYLLPRLIISSGPDIWLDNDYGILIPANIVLSEFDVDPNWDWRCYQAV